MLTALRRGDVAPYSPAALRITRPVIVAACVYVVAFGAWATTNDAPERTRTVVSDVVFLPVYLAAAGFALVVARTHPRRGRRLAWGWFAAAFFSWWFGDASWFYFEVIRHTAPFPSIADVGYLAFYPCLLVGILMLLREIPVRIDAARLGLDFAIVAVAATTFVWFLVIEPTSSDLNRSLESALALAYPVGDLLLLFGLGFVLLRRAATRNALVVLLLTAGTTVLVVADIAYARLQLNGGYYPGDWVDVLWLLAQVIFLGAAVVAWTFRPALPVEAEEPTRLFSTLPYSSIAAAYALLLVLALSMRTSRLTVLVLALGALTTLVVVRQIAALRDNERLVSELAAAEARSRAFLADAAHQLRTPIAGVQASAEVLATIEATPAQAQLLKNLVHETSRAGSLISALLRTARLDQGEQLAPKECDVTELCRVLVDQARVVSPLLTIDLHVPDALVMKLDGGAVADVLSNLIDNARRFARQQVEVVVQREGAAVVVDVRDDGSGLSPTDAERAFERFVSLDGRGSGLGLPIARQLAEAHGGGLVYEDAAFRAWFSSSLPDARPRNT